MVTQVNKAVPAHAMKLYWGSRRTAPLILNLSTRYRLRDQLHAPAALPPGEKAGAYGIGGRVAPEPIYDLCLYITRAILPRT